VCVCVCVLFARALPCRTTTTSTQPPTPAPTPTPVAGCYMFAAPDRYWGRSYEKDGRTYKALDSDNQPTDRADECYSNEAYVPWVVQFQADGGQCVNAISSAHLHTRPLQRAYL